MLRHSIYYRVTPRHIMLCPMNEDEGEGVYMRVVASDNELMYHK